MKQELLPVVNYLPDVEAIKRNGVKVIMAVGQMSLDKKRMYAEIARILADLLDCELIVFPGHHSSYIDMPEEWTAVLRDTLHR